MTNYLAHGALGNFDELVFFGIIVIFMVMMGISWFRSLNEMPEEQEKLKSTDDLSSDPERFHLD